MMNKTLKVVVTFYTSDAAFACEKACDESHIDGALISAPRELTSDCGISYKCELKDKENIEKLLTKKNIEYDKICEINIY